MLAIGSYTKFLAPAKRLAPIQGWTSARVGASAPTAAIRGLSQQIQSDDPKYTLYQYAICPYCNIAKTLFHYGRIPYKAVEVNPLTKKEIGHLDKDYRKVPIVTLSNSESTEQVNGSDVIVDHLLEQFSSSSLAKKHQQVEQGKQKWRV